MRSRTPDEAARAGASESLPVSVGGLAAGAELWGEGSLRWDEAWIALELPARPSGPRMLRWPFGDVEGVRYQQGELTLFLHNGDVVELTGSARLGEAARELEARACTFEEMTRGLRALGSARAAAGPEQARFFAPLLGARRRASRALGWQAQLAAFEPAAIREAVEAALGEMAARRHPRSAPDRRALEAELGECAERFQQRLDALAAAADAVRDSGDDTRLARWREWTSALHAVFEGADRCWLALHPVLAAAPAPRRRPWWKRALRLGALAFAAVSIVVAPAAAQRRSARVTLRVPGVSAESLLARGFDVVTVHEGAALVVADSAARARLASLGWIGTTVPVLAAELAPGLPVDPDAPTVTTVYRAFDDPVRGVRFLLDSLAAANPRVHLDTLGFSVEGRPILAAKIGERTASAARPNVLFLATYHAREWVATEMALRLVRHLAAPDADARTHALVQGRDIWIVPVVNPDGYQYTFTDDRLWRKNRRPLEGGAVGVDLNRNHSVHWGEGPGSSPDPASEIYRGTAPASEPETRAIEAFHARHPPVTAVSYHSFTGLILYPPGFRYGLLPEDLGIYRALAGTDERPAALDRVPGSDRAWYHPGPGWNLYATNGEYTDFAYGAAGAIAFTPELTSGFTNGRYYGFEFPDDEALIQTVFTDNLPFALDVIEAAADPSGHRSANTGLRDEPLVLESIAPVVRVRAHATLGAIAVEASGPRAMTRDTVGFGVYTHRYISDRRGGQRPDRLTITTGAAPAAFHVLSATGAEAGDPEWSAENWTSAPDSRVAGSLVWATASDVAPATLRSPSIRVPDDADTVSVLFWTRHIGDGFRLHPFGEVRVSVNGAPWQRVASVSGIAPEFYPERAVIGGVRGRRIEVAFQTTGLAWRLDEIAVVAHAGSSSAPAPVAIGVSENPVRQSTVSFTWPFGATGGEIAVYDFAGRRVWSERVAVVGSPVTWDIAASGVANGAYVVVARAGGRIARQKLLVLRGTP